MPEEKLPICCNELEGFLVNECDCAFLENGNVNLLHYETYLEKIRPFFVSTLEERIYALLERFIYSEDADRFHEQFPCLKNCIGQTTTTLSTRVNENSCGNRTATGNDIQDVITRAIKCLIKEGVFGAFINSLVVNNRINRIGRQLDALDFQKHSLAFLNVCNFVCQTDYWIDQSCGCGSELDATLSDLTVEVGTDDRNSTASQVARRSHGELGNDSEIGSAIFRKLSQSDSDFRKESSSSSYQTNPEIKYLRTTISKVQFSSCGCVDIVKSKKCGQLKLPCKPDDLMKNIYRVEQNFPDLRLLPVRQKFDESISNVCSHLNDILVGMDGGTISNMCLICEIRPGYINFKLKSLLVEFHGSKSFLYSARVATSEITNSRTSISENEIQHETLSSQKCIGINYCRQNCLSVVSEEDEEEIIKIDFPKNSDKPSPNDSSSSKVSSDIFFEAQTSPEPENSLEVEVSEEPEIGRELSNSHELEIPDLEIVEINNPKDPEIPKVCCPCEELSVSKHSFSQIELKLQDLSECLKKFTIQIESHKSEEVTIDAIHAENSPVELADEEEVSAEKLDESDKKDENSDAECLCSGENLQGLPNSSVNQKLENQESHQNVQNHQNQSDLRENQNQNQPELQGNQNHLVSQDKHNLQDQSNRPNHQDTENRQGKEDNNPEIYLSIQKSKKSFTSKIPISTCRISLKFKDSKGKQKTGSFPCSQKENSCERKCKPCSISKIPVLRKKIPKPSESPRANGFTNRNRNSLIPVPSERQESRSGPLVPRKRSTSEEVKERKTQRNSEVSRCFAIKSTVPKSQQMEARNHNKTSTNVTFIKLNVSSTFLPKANVPQPAKRNVLCPNPLPRKSLPKIDQSVCTESFDSVQKVDQKTSANILPKSEEKPTFVIVTDSEEAIQSCDSECPCRGSFDTPEGNIFSCLCFEKSDENLKSKNLETSLLKGNFEISPTKFRGMQEGISQDQTEFISNRPKDQTANIEIHLNTNSQKSNSPTNQKVSNVHQISKEPSDNNLLEIIVKQKSLNGCIPRLEETVKNLKTNTFKEIEVQTMERRVMTEGININIRETKERISKAISVQTEPRAKDVNLNVVAKDSVISLQTNVTKIISIIDITIFENGSELQKCTKPLEGIYGRGFCPGCPKIMSPNGSSAQKGTLPLLRVSSYLSDSLLPRSSPCPKDTPYPKDSPFPKDFPCAADSPFTNYHPCPAFTEKPPLINNSPLSQASRNSNERNPNLKPNVDAIIFDKHGQIKQRKIKQCCCGRSKRMGSIDSWLCPKSVAKAQSIFKTICEPFSQKSIDRMKYLIRKKLCHLLLDQDGDGSKSFVSNERYYVSVSKEKTCSSHGKISSSRFSVTTNSIRQTSRMAGGSDNPAFDCVTTIRNRWEFQGEDTNENDFLNGTFSGKCKRVDEDEERCDMKKGNHINKSEEEKRRRKLDKMRVEVIKRGRDKEGRKRGGKGGRRVNRGVSKKEKGKEEEIGKEEEKGREQGKEEKSKKEGKEKREGRGEKEREEEKRKGEENGKKDEKRKKEEKGKEEKGENGKEKKGQQNGKRRWLREIEEEKIEVEKIRSKDGKIYTSGIKQIDPKQDPKKAESFRKYEIKRRNPKTNTIIRKEEKTAKRKTFVSPGDMITSCHLGRGNRAFFQQRGQTDGTRESDKENGFSDSRKTLQGRFNFNNEKGQFSSSEMQNFQGENRFSHESGGIEESFSDLEQNVKSKLREYVSLCKSVKYLISKGSNNM